MECDEQKQPAKHTFKEHIGATNTGTFQSINLQARVKIN
jgi:hypothetical protein